MEIVNRLGGESKMDADELSRIFNDSAVSWTSKYLFPRLILFE